MTHRGCTNNVVSTLFSTLSQISAASKIAQSKGEEIPEPATTQHATIIAAPLFHVTTNNCTAQLQTFLGGKLDADSAVKAIDPSLRRQGARGSNQAEGKVA